jgi:repressor of nif and glnA expression
VILVAVAHEGETLGEVTVRPGKVALATVCSVVINGTLLKAGIPVDSRFGGILQVRNQQPLRFVEIIHHAGSSVDPSNIFIRAMMTSVIEAANKGDGKILANFREIPAPGRFGGLLVMGNTGEPVCGIPVELNRVGMVLLGGLNPVAAVKEVGIDVENDAMGTVIEYKELVKFSEV